VFSAAAIMSVLGAIISLMRGKQFYYDGPDDPGPRQTPAAALVNGNGHAPANGNTPANGHASANGPGGPANGQAAQPPGNGLGATQAPEGGRPAGNPPTAKGV
jgi:hypothetical protein